MGELPEVDHDLDRIWIEPHSGDTCPFVKDDANVNPISRALEEAGMPNSLRSDSRFQIEHGRWTLVYSVSDTVEEWLMRWIAMARRFTKDKSDDRTLEGINLIVDHANRFIHTEWSADTYHRIVLTFFDRLVWMLLLFIEEERDLEKRTTMARQLAELFHVEEEDA